MDRVSAASRLRFDRFEFEPSTGELYRDSCRVHLQEHPRQVLLALLERPGDIVTREHLRERLWGTDTFVDFEHGLNTAVKKARQALGDSAETPQFIETLARRGYRFIGRIDGDAPASIGSVAADSTSSTSSRPAALRDISRRSLWRAAAAILLVAGGVAIWIAQRPANAGTARAGAQLAVMPFRVITGSTDSAYLGIGVADAITTRLANTRQIAVRPTTAVLTFQDAQSDPTALAASLGVRHLLLGTIQPTDQAYRVTVQLVRADGVAIWGRTFDEPRATLLRLQDQLAEQVVGALRVELSPPERARLHVRYTNNAAAYDMYLRGRSLLVNYTEAKMHEAIMHFEQALQLDENYALARTGIATASAWFSVRYAHDAAAVAWGKRADEEARRALAQDSGLADAHLAIASAAGTEYRGFDWRVVIDESATALALDPSLDLAHLARMRAYYHLGLFVEARHQGDLAVAVNPIANVERDRLEISLMLFGGQYSDAVEAATRLTSQTDAPAVRQYLGLARFYVGDANGAREMLGSIRRGDRPDTRAQASLASIEAAIGMHNEARSRVVEIMRGSELDHHVAYSVGAALAQLGDVDASLRWLQRAADTGFPCYPWFERDPLLDPLRKH
ncbi:MAG TPA: winged helix-turn-helix domain-containing protein, partial [Vicinamibacterales bacterium]|nr:winged helix-turn-helix domain-containing protein [Vicinamibacterales bacterium]